MAICWYQPRARLDLPTDCEQDHRLSMDFQGPSRTVKRPENLAFAWFSVPYRTSWDVQYGGGGVTHTGAGNPHGCAIFRKRSSADTVKCTDKIVRCPMLPGSAGRRRALVVPRHPVVRLGRVTVTGGLTPADSRHGSARLPLSLQGAAPGTYAPLRLFLFSRVKPWKPSTSPSVASPTRFAGK